MSSRRAVARFGTILTAASATVALVATSAHANVSTFVGNALTFCTVNDQRLGVVTGVNTCRTEGTAAVCVTTLDAPEASVAGTCSGTLVADTTHVYVQRNGQPFVACAGTGSGTFFYEPTQSSPTVAVPVTVTVHGQTGEFGGEAVLGLDTMVVAGTFSAACGGFGTYLGQVA